MPDVLCRCGEPWDWWTIRDEVLKFQPLYDKMAKYGGTVTEVGTGVVEDGYREVTKAEIAKSDTPNIEATAGYILDPHASWEFKVGPYPIQCPACFGQQIEPAENSDIIEALQDVLGNDVDGLMASLKDFDLL